jgi:hypothetical protein
MGWRASDAYESDAEIRWRAMPWRKRYNWRGVAVFVLIVVATCAYLWARF